MIWLVLGLGASIAYALFLTYKMDQQKRDHVFNTEVERTEHAKCIAHIASVVSARVIAITLRDLADTWETIENRAELKRLVREQWIEDGPSIPALWLYEKARLIEEGK